MSIKLIITMFALAAGQQAFANQLIDCTGCTPQQFQLAAMDALDGVHIVYDLNTGVSRKFAVRDVDCNSRATPASPNKRTNAPVPYCWGGNAIEMPVDATVLTILRDLAIFNNQFPGYLQNSYAKDIEINLDSPPIGFSDPPISSGNVSGHHDIVGIALDRNFSNPMQNDFRFNNFAQSIDNWLRGPDVPADLRGFVSLVSRVTSANIQIPMGPVGDAGAGLSWNLSEYLIRVVVKDGFDNKILMTFDPKTGVLTINQILSSNGNPFPSKFQDQFSTSFPDQNLAGNYVGALENAGIQVSHGSGGGGGIRATSWWQVTCVRTGNGPMTCVTFAE